MSFTNDSSRARVAFANSIKAEKLDPTSLKYWAEFDNEEKLCFVYASDSNDDVRAVQSFPLSAEAWNLNLKKEIEKMFRGSAIISVRGRC